MSKNCSVWHRRKPETSNKPGRSGPDYAAPLAPSAALHRSSLCGSSLGARRDLTCGWVRVDCGMALRGRRLFRGYGTARGVPYPLSQTWRATPAISNAVMLSQPACGTVPDSQSALIRYSRPLIPQNPAIQVQSRMTKAFRHCWMPAGRRVAQTGPIPGCRVAHGRRPKAEDATAQRMRLVWQRGSSVAAPGPWPKKALAGL